jgi:hypothetical protein
VLDAALAAGALDQDAAHRLRGGEEVAPAVPAPLVGVAEQAQVGLLDEGGRLQRLPGGSRSPWPIASRMWVSWLIVMPRLGCRMRPRRLAGRPGIEGACPQRDSPSLPRGARRRSIFS